MNKYQDVNAQGHAANRLSLTETNQIISHVGYSSPIDLNIWRNQIEELVGNSKDRIISPESSVTCILSNPLCYVHDFIQSSVAVEIEVLGIS